MWSTMNQSHPFLNSQHIANFWINPNNHDKCFSHSTFFLHIIQKNRAEKAFFSLSTTAQTQLYKRPDQTTDIMYHLQIYNRNSF